MFVKFLIHLTVLEILGKLGVDMCFCLQTCISAVVMAVVIGQSLIDLPFIMYYAQCSMKKANRGHKNKERKKNIYNIINK